MADNIETVGAEMDSAPTGCLPFFTTIVLKDLHE